MPDTDTDPRTAEVAPPERQRLVRAAVAYFAARGCFWLHARLPLPAGVSAVQLHRAALKRAFPEAATILGVPRGEIPDDAPEVMGPPPVLRGTREDHRPDATCTWRGGGGAVADTVLESDGGPRSEPWLLRFSLILDNVRDACKPGFLVELHLFCESEALAARLRRELTEGGVRGLHVHGMDLQ